MARRIFSFDEPERFVAGTVGQPGSRAFFLQARDGRRIVTVALEKAQVAVLADRLRALLDELDQRGVRTRTDDPGLDHGPLDEPVDEAFRAGTLSLTWDGDRERIIVEAREIAADDGPDEPVEISDEDESGPDLIRVVMRPAAAREFADQAAGVVAAGRPPCPLCGRPLDPGGHICPRRNGYLN